MSRNGFRIDVIFLKKKEKIEDVIKDCDMKPCLSDSH